MDDLVAYHHTLIYLSPISKVKYTLEWSSFSTHGVPHYFLSSIMASVAAGLTSPRTPCPYYALPITDVQLGRILLNTLFCRRSNKFTESRQWCI